MGAISELVPYKCLICKERLEPMFHDDMDFLFGIIFVLYIVRYLSIHILMTNCL